MKFLSQINVNTEYTLPIVDGTNGQVLTTDGSGAVYWGSVSIGALNLDGLQDVVITTPTSGQILRYGIPVGSEDPNPVWHNWSPNFLTFASSINALADVTITSATTGQLLQWNGTTWVNWTPNFLTSYTETDTLASVTTRGNTTTNTITVGGATSNYLILSGASSLLESKGLLKWESDHNSVGIYYADGKHFDIGQSQMWYVKNTSDATLAKGTVVMATGAVGNSGNLEVQPLIADGTVSGRFALGIAMDDIAVGAFGFVKTEGTIRGIDTSEYTIGTVLYADPAIAGGLTSIEPTAPSLKLPIAFVVSAASNGAIGVRMTQGLDLQEIHDVTISSVANGQLLRYNAGVWSNWTPNFLTSFTETDPTVPAHVKSITTTNISNWNTAYGWGNHATQGYATQTWVGLNYYNEGEIDDFFSGAEPISGYNKSNWDTAYGWGNHALAGYLTSIPDEYLTQPEADALYQPIGSYLTAEADTLATVTARGNISNTKIQIRTAGNTAGGNIQLGPYSDGASKWAFITAQHYNSSLEPEGFSLIGGLAVNGVNAVVIGGNIYESNPATQIQFWTHSSDTHGLGGTQRGVIDSSGNWGVGTTGPNSKFHVAGSIYSTEFTTPVDGQIPAIQIGYDSSAGIGILNTWSSRPLRIEAFNDVTIRTTGTDRLIVKATTGNVGINNTNPTAQLQVGPEAHPNATGIEVAAGAGGANLLARDANTHHNWFPYTNGDNYYSAGAHHFRSAEHGTPWVIISASDFTWSGNTVATRTWVQSQGYLTSETDSQTLSWDFNSKNLSISNGNTVTLDGLATEEFVTSQGYLTSLPAHTHTIANVTGLQTALDGKLSTSGKAADSEAVDGIDSARIVYGDGANGRSVGRSNGSANISDSSNASGFYYGYNVTGMPTGDWWNWLTVRGEAWSGSDGYQFQIAGSFWGDDYRIRRMTSGTNHAWVSIIHSGNIGSQSVNYANSAGSATTAGTASQAGFVTNQSGQLLRFDNRIIAPNETNAAYMQFGFTSWSNNNTAPWADYLHLRSYEDGSGGSDNLVMFRKDGIGMRIWQQSFGSASAYSSFVDVWTTGNFTQTNVNNWNSAYSWGNHAEAGYWNTDLADPKTVQSTDVIFAGNVTVEGTFTESSSIRFKENITPLDPALDKVNQLEAVSYNKIGVDDREIGLIAEDVAELFPEVVTYDEEGAPMGVQYQRLSVILLKAVQELTERVNKLENK